MIQVATFNLSLVSLFAISLFVQADEKKQSDDGFVSLFDGKTLNGWSGAKDAYGVENGNIVCVKGTAGNLLTEKEYADFVIRFEFKLTDGANNGLGIRSMAFSPRRKSSSSRSENGTLKK